MNVVLDLDGTLATWKDGGPSGGGEEQVGQWLPGARDALCEMLLAGDKVVVASCRATWPDGGGWQAVATFLRSGGFSPWLVTGNGPTEEWRMLDELNTPIGSPFSWETLGKGRLVGVWVGVGKPLAHAYVDDRAVAFSGDWPAAVVAARAFA